jgi:hypothetical protein
MKRTLPYLITALLLLVSFSCADKDTQQQIACTEVFFSVNVTFKGANGDFMDVEEYSSVNTRTNKVLSRGKENSSAPLGTYLVTDDGDRKEFSRSGDIVLVSAKHPATGIVKTAEFKIAADECHINKISGPAVIKFD